MKKPISLGKAKEKRIKKSDWLIGIFAGIFMSIMAESLFISIGDDKDIAALLFPLSLLAIILLFYYKMTNEIPDKAKYSITFTPNPKENTPEDLFNFLLTKLLAFGKKRYSSLKAGSGVRVFFPKVRTYRINDTFKRDFFGGPLIMLDWYYGDGNKIECRVNYENEIYVRKILKQTMVWLKRKNLVTKYRIDGPVYYHVLGLVPVQVKSNN